MKSVLGRARVPVFAVAAACLLAVGAGWAIAASTSSTATIRACASKSNGALRLAARCKSSERRVSWNTVGPRGPRGATGVAGANGIDGATGPMGPAGIALIGAVAGPAGAMCANGGGGCQVASSTATCPAGTVALGGGYTSDSPDLVVPFTARTGGTTFGVIGINYDAMARSITAQAICATGPGVSSAGAAQAQQSFGNAISSFKAQLAN
jgi:hypothetical protein